MFKVKYTDIITIENHLATWDHFIRGKGKKKDVIAFQFYLADNLVQLQKELAEKTYEHSGYTAFNISDPKPGAFNLYSFIVALLGACVLIGIVRTIQR